ncbi:hypothetical protein HZH68_009082 [Vespula germanica]|uniref:Uncharacterized protein n=1 Tax=Vespula germanica TaxID=30212 RepID=A0A834N5U3_VESGE|nr:hypothetical protein HZH68_009082 [Vespula germanica]
MIAQETIIRRRYLTKEGRKRTTATGTAAAAAAAAATTTAAAGIREKREEKERRVRLITLIRLSGEKATAGFPVYVCPSYRIFIALFPVFP